MLRIRDGSPTATFRPKPVKTDLMVTAKASPPPRMIEVESVDPDDENEVLRNSLRDANMLLMNKLTAHGKLVGGSQFHANRMKGMPCTSCQALHIEIKELRDQYKSLLLKHEETCANLKEEKEKYSELDDMKSKIEIQYEQCQRNMSCVQAAYDKAQTELDKLKADKRKWIQDKAEFSLQITQFKQDIAESKLAVADKENQLKEVKRELEEKTKELENLKNNKGSDEKIRIEYEIQIKELNERINKLLEENEQSNKTIDTLSKSLSEKQLLIDHLQQEQEYIINNNKENISTLENEIKELKEALKIANEEIQMLRKSQSEVVEVKPSETTNNEVQTEPLEDINIYKDKVKDLEKEIEELKNQKPPEPIVVTETKKDEELEMKYKDQVKINDELNKQLSALNSTIDELHKKLTDLENKTKQSDIDYNDKINALKEEIVKKTDENKQLDESNKQQSTQIKELSNKVDEKQKKIEELENQINTSKHETISNSLFNSIRLSVVTPNVKVVIGSKTYSSVSKLSDAYIQKILDQEVIPEFGRMYLSVGGQENKEMQEWLNSLGEQLQMCIKQNLQTQAPQE